MSATAPAPSIDTAEIVRALQVILQSGQVTELRALEAVTSEDRRPHTESGYFNDPAALAKAVERIKSARGFYFIPNPARPALMARAVNKCRAVGRDPTTSDVDIAKRDWLLIDCDATRPSGVSASDDEHDAALEKINTIVDWLTARGWPAPIKADSGNGGHLLYRVDLPRDDDGLIERCLKALAKEHDNDAVTVDQKVFNPARIWKLYGTVAGKGDAEAAAIGRPQRLARLIDAPVPLEVVSRELLESLAGPAEVKPTNGHASGNGHATFNLEQWIGQHFPEARHKQTSEGDVWILDPCPWNAQHVGGSAHVIQRLDGKIGAACKHNGCAGLGWHDLRELFEPGHRERRIQPPRFNGRPAPDESEAPYVEAEQQRPPIETSRESVEFKRFTCADLDAAEFETEYLVEGTLVAREPAVMAGGKKNLKTSMLIDLGISLAIGGYFLGKLKVNRAVRVAIFSGESGLATIQETLRRIADAAGHRLSDIGGLIISPDLPRFGRVAHEEALGRFLKNDEIEVGIVEPAYLAMDSDGSEGNLFAMGSKLRGINEVCKSSGTQLVICHHTKRGVVNPFQPPELEDIAWAGFQEWARQWLLVGRREKYEPGTGFHQLWLNVGGSAGHSSLWAVNVNEGIYDGTTPRRWEVDLLPATEAREQSEQLQADVRTAKAAEKRSAELEADRKAVVQLLVKDRSGDTKRGIKDRLGLRTGRVDSAVASLLADGTLAEAEVTRTNGRKYDGFIINPKAET
jgi:hypothetical protein